MSTSTCDEKLAISGGDAVRDEQENPWPSWPMVSDEEWRQRVEPALHKVYVSRSEGLPGKESRALALRFAAFCGADFGRMVPSGTCALGAALTGVLDLGTWDDGGEVILPNFTFIATASSALDRRCTLALVDIDTETMTIDPDQVERAIVPGKTRAIVPVHMGGHPADMARLQEIARRHDLKIIEDCAQAHGAVCEGRGVGAWGDAGAFSFQSSKNLTSGEGGLVVTNDEAVDHRVSAFMNVGRDPEGARWEYPRIGWNYRPSEYLAALLSVRFDDLDQQTEHRNRMAETLGGLLAEVPGITPPQNASRCTRHGYHIFAMLYDADLFGGRCRDDAIAALKAEGIPCFPGYPHPLSESPALKYHREKHPDTVRVLDCPNAWDVCNRSIWLGHHVLLTDEEDMNDIARAFAKIQRSFSA